MYEAFDAFCRRATWDTSHPSDIQIFRAALRNVIRKPNFSPDEMGEYIRRNHAKPIWPKSEEVLDDVIQGLVHEARTALKKSRR